LPGAVEQAGTELGFELADLPAQRGLRDPQLGRGSAEVPVPGDGGEVPHQPKVEVGREWCGVGHASMVWHEPMIIN
jgi:hypothetical protein